MRLDEALNACAVAALTASRQEKLPSKELFADPAAGATELYIAALKHLGPEFVHFEPETIWATFDVETVNRDQLLAAMGLASHPAFFWDFRTFGNTCLAFGDHAVVPDVVPRPEARDMAWALFEAELLNALSSEPGEPELDEEVLAYIATILHEEGFIVAPDLLEPAQEYLDRMTSPDALSLKTEVLREWDALKDHALERIPTPTNALGVQLARLAEVRLYLVKRAEALTARLKAL